MGSGPRWLLVVGLILLGVGEIGWVSFQAVQRARVDMRAAMARADARPSVAPKMPAHLFTRNEANTFLDKAKAAEAIADPLQRCLAYPDPPGSHWSADTVGAYCNYRLHSVITFAEVQKLIQDDRAAEVDQRFKALLQEQLTDPQAHGRLDRAFYQDFRSGSFDIRPTLDAWKRDSPNSAFAWAASGYAYVQMAADARGDQYVSDTPQSSIEAMDRLLAQADTDLRHAIALDPHLPPVYAEMIHAGGLSLGEKYAQDAAQRGHAIAPDDLEIYRTQMWLEEPNWYGSLAAMDKLADQAQAHVGKNPMLRILLSQRPLYEVEHCHCTALQQLAAYPAALDHLGMSGDLRAAGDVASGSNHQVALIYLSEALRFAPELDDARIKRVYDLVDFDEPEWAVTDANRMVAAHPHDEDPLKARAFAYTMQGDYSHAEQDYRSAIRITPADLQSLAQLGSLYVNQTHDWDKGWAVADQLIKARPDNPYGWMLRAEIQQRQPRPGLKDTVEYFEAHFGSKDAPLHKLAVQMRSAMVLQKHSGTKVLAAKPVPAAR